VRTTFSRGWSLQTRPLLVYAELLFLLMRKTDNEMSQIYLFAFVFFVCKLCELRYSSRDAAVRSVNVDEYSFMSKNWLQRAHTGGVARVPYLCSVLKTGRNVTLYDYWS